MNLSDALLVAELLRERAADPSCTYAQQERCRRALESVIDQIIEMVTPPKETK